MNKQEAIEQLYQKCWENSKEDDPIIYVSDVINIINQINEPQKTVIPKFVVEWIERCKENNDTLYHALQDNDDVNDWLDRDDNEDLFARAWVNGYEAEKEKLYTVEIPNNGGTLVLTSINGRIKLDHGYKHFPAKLTEEKIKEKFDWIWKWAKPAEAML